jgi:hypothetical protein
MPEIEWKPVRTTIVRRLGRFGFKVRIYYTPNRIYERWEISDDAGIIFHNLQQAEAHFFLQGLKAAEARNREGRWLPDSQFP